MAPTPCATVLELPVRPDPTPRSDGPLGELLAFPAPAADVELPPVPDTIPDEVWAEMDRAFERALALELSGRRVGFSAPRERGERVRVEVLDADGRVVRPVALGEAIAFGTGLDDGPLVA